MTIRETSVGRAPAARILHTAGFVIGSVLTVIAIAMIATGLVSLIAGELRPAAGIGAAAAITLLAGYLLRRHTPRPTHITAREGFATVGISWFVFSLFGALPYLLTGTIPSVVDAVFESASGFTTTGFSVITDPRILPVGISFWRGLTQWLGGMGVIALGVIVLPLLGTGGAQLAQAESSGPTLDRLTPRFQGTAIRLLGVYVVITVLEVAFLWVGDMSGFQALIHSFTTVATGGFSTEPTSIAGFSPYSQWVITVFMVLSGVSFALHFRGMKRPSEYARSAELRLYLLILVAAVVIVTGGLWRFHEADDAIRFGAFNTISVATGTGFTSTDIGAWRPALHIILVGLMFLGGMAGSTSGAIKTFRVGVLAKAAFADVRRVVRPRAVLPTKFGKRTVPLPVVEAVQSFFLFYMMTFITATFLIAFIDANANEGLDLLTVASSVASSMGNVGAGLGLVGPAGPGFERFPDLAKLLLSGTMIVGRLEIFPVLVLFTKDLWRR